MLLAFFVVVAVITFFLTMGLAFGRWCDSWTTESQGVKLEFKRESHVSQTVVGWTVAETFEALCIWDRWDLEPNAECYLNGRRVENHLLNRTLLTTGDKLLFIPAENEALNQFLAHQC